MPDTTLRIRYPAGATLYTQVETEAGLVWNGSAFVAFVVAGWGTYAVSTPEGPAGSGRYAAQFPLSAPAGNYTWAHYLRMGGSPASTDPVVGTGDGTWTGTTFGSSAVDLTPVLATLGTPAGASLAADIAAVASGTSGDADLKSDVVVDDPAPSVLGFTVAMADASDVPDTFVWREGLACFTAASGLRTGKFPIATYTKLTDTTARITFLPALPAAAADAEAFRII
jgi:hypothetical protein